MKVLRSATAVGFEWRSRAVNRLETLALKKLYKEFSFRDFSLEVNRREERGRNAGASRMAAAMRSERTVDSPSNRSLGFASL
jgi:hypothetical protein